MIVNTYIVQYSVQLYMYIIYIASQNVMDLQIYEVHTYVHTLTHIYA